MNVSRLYLVIPLILLIVSGWVGWAQYNQVKMPDTAGVREHCEGFEGPRHSLSDCLVRLKISGKRRGWQEDLRQGLWFHYTDKEPKSCFALYQAMDDNTIVIATLEQCGERVAMTRRFIDYYNRNYASPVLSLDSNQIFSGEDYAIFSQHEMWLPPSPQ